MLNDRIKSRLMTYYKGLVEKRLKTSDYQIWHDIPYAKDYYNLLKSHLPRYEGSTCDCCQLKYSVDPQMIHKYLLVELLEITGFSHSCQLKKSICEQAIEDKHYKICIECWMYLISHHTC
ncbi:TPA_asm: protein 4 [Cucumis virus 1]|uniref:Protein 4 n=1 Tax=Cucumis virus 1 TaxID=2977964 RepID=A0A9N6YIW3_9RHAB|nr:TPA_asm: protein 4 [Cucumis virus 1]